MKDKKNTGFTLIEMIVVIAIMAVALGITSYSLGSLQSFRAKGCAQDIKSALDLTRTTAMATGGSSVTITKDASTGEIMVTRSGNAAESVGKSTLTITYQFKNDTTVYTLGDAAAAAKPLTISFATSGSINDSNVVEWIRISGSKTYRITLYKLTGKAELDAE